ncbi:MAG: NAD(P)-binding protein [Lachnospiraceae bacterium]
MKRYITIVGAGVAGLTAGIYARKCGFETTILEKHTIPGGNCTSWKRDGYLFEGGMHWLNGTKGGTFLNDLWIAKI